MSLETAVAGSPVSSRDAGALLERLRSALGALGKTSERRAVEVGELGGRLNQGIFHLAVLGQFKRGKSTLLNALLGEVLLPTSVVPLTAIPTFIRYGSPLGMTVRFEDERPPESFTASHARDINERLAGYVTEAGNPKNKLGVEQVDVRHSAPLLRKGVVLIDTPGIGSTFRHNTEMTLNFLPQCDAALFLVSADPPMTEVEVAFLKQIRTKVARLFFLLNKVDYLSEAERNESLAFLRKVLAEQVGVAADTPIFCVSARQGLEARKSGDKALWANSGLEAVEQHLVDFLAEEKAGTLHRALARKAADIAAEALMELRLEHRSLEMPAEELRQRITLFEQKIQEAQRERTMAGDLLAGDSKRIHEYLEEYAADLRAKAAKYLDAVGRKVLAGSESGVPDPEAVREALAEAVPVFFERCAGEMTSAFNRRITDLLKGHQRRADELISSVRRAAAELFEIPHRAPESVGAFEMVQQPYWVTHKWTSSLSPLPEGAVDRLLPAGIRRTRIRKRIKQQIDALVISNVENLRWATYQSIDTTFRRFSTALDERLGETVAATHGALLSAVERRQTHTETVAEEVARLRARELELMGLQAALEEAALP